MTATERIADKRITYSDWVFLSYSCLDNINPSCPIILAVRARIGRSTQVIVHLFLFPRCGLI